MQVLVIGNPRVGLAAALAAKMLSERAGVIVINATAPEVELPKIELPKLDPFLLHPITEELALKPDPVPSWIKEKRKKKRK